MAENAFAQLGIDDIDAGVELFNSLGLTPFDLSNGPRLNQLREIVEFLNDHPDPAWVVRSVSRSNRNPDRSNLEHLLVFVRLQRERIDLQQQIDRVDKELQHYG